MFADALRKQFEHTCWATGHILETAENLTQEQLMEPGGAGHGSIRDTLIHMIRTHRGWLSWWDGSLSAEAAYNMPLDPADYPDVPSLKRLWADVERQTLAFIAGLQDGDPDQLYGFDLPNGQRWEMPLWD